MYFSFNFRALISLFLLVSSQICLLLMYIVLEKSYDESLLSITMIIVVFILIFFFSSSEEESVLKRQYFKVSSLFVLSFSIVHFQFYIDLIMGYTTIYSKYTINPDVVNKSSLISALSLGTFFIGYIFKSNISFSSVRIKKVVGDDFSPQTMKVVLFSIFAGVIFFTPLNYYNAGYITVELPTIATIFHKAFIYAAAAYLMLNSNKAKSDFLDVNTLFRFIKFNGISVFIVLVAFCMLVLMSGDRGPIIQIGLAFIGVYVFSTRKKYSLATVCSVLVIASLFISLLSHIRHLDNISSPLMAIEMSLERDTSTNSNATISQATEELARSVRTVHAAIDYTNQNGFSYGYYKALHVINLVPGLGSLVIPLLDLDREAKSTLVITEHIGSDHGMGTSIIADMWIDFGLFGIIIMFFFFGWFLRVVDVASYSTKKISLFWNALIISFLITVINISRGTILDSFKTAVMIYLLVLISIFIKSILPGKRCK